MDRLLSALRMSLAAVVFCFGLAIIAPGEAAGQSNPTDKLKNLDFREIGPAVMGGRIDDFGVVESNPNIVYVGTASGGVWKTTSNGTTWEPVFDCRRSVTSRSLRLIRPLCGSGQDSRIIGRVLRGEMGFISRWMPGRPGRRWGWRRRITSGAL